MDAATERKKEERGEERKEEERGEEREEEGRGEEREEEGSGEEREVEKREEERGEVPMQWVKKETLSNTIAEEISDKQVSHRNSRTQEPISVVYNYLTHTHTHAYDGVVFFSLQYEELISRLSQLAAHPLSNRSKHFLDRFRRPLFSYRSHAKVAQLEEGGEASAVGRRKTSTAHVTLKPGSGEVRINERSLLEYFPIVEDRQQVLFPLMVTEQLDRFDVTAAVRGGGTTGELRLLPPTNADIS